LPLTLFCLIGVIEKSSQCITVNAGRMWQQWYKFAALLQNGVIDAEKRGPS